MTLTIMNKQIAEQYLNPLVDKFGISLDIFQNFGFLINGVQEKIWISTKECMQADLNNIRVDTMGLLFARCGKLPNEFKPTTNIMQLFGKHATKNVLNLNDEQKIKFARGLDFEITQEQQQQVSDGFVIVKHLDDYYGVALLQGYRLKNQVPKTRRIKKL